MANVFVHFEPIGPVGEEVKINPDLPQYVIRGKFSKLDTTFISLHLLHMWSLQEVFIDSICKALRRRLIGTIETQMVTRYCLPLHNKVQLMPI
jgi:hypothetical protein